MGSRILLNLLLLPKFRLSSARLRSADAREQGFSIAVVLIAMLSVVVAGVAMANRTQSGRLAATASSSNREAREVADTGINYVISEWNRPPNRGMFNSLQSISSWDINNSGLRNPCRDTLEPTVSATSALKTPIELDSNRSFSIEEVTFRDATGSSTFTTRANGSDSTLPAGFTANDVSEIDLVVKGTYKRGNNTSTAFATRRFTLETIPPTCGSTNNESKGVFAYGGTTPNSVNTLNTIPTYWFQNGAKLSSKNVDAIYCTPLVNGTVSTDCLKTTAGNPSVPVKAVSLSSSEKALRNPPTIQSIALAAGLPGGNPPPAQSISKDGNTNTTLTGNEPNCFIYKGAGHCNVSFIAMAGKALLTIDSTAQPVYLYVSGNISLVGTSDIKHLVKYKDGVLNASGTTKQVLGDLYSNIAQFEEDAFRFQIRGNPAGTSKQTFSMNGTPTANLLYWAPNANLSMGGSSGTTLSSALFVNSLTLTGDSNIKLISQPGSFGFNLGPPGEDRKTVTARSALFNKFF